MTPIPGSERNGIMEYFDPAEEYTNPTPCEETVTEPCPSPVDVRFEGCEDSLVFNAGKVALDSLGRILQLDVTLEDVCPGKRVALAVVVTEVDEQGHEHPRGFKTLVVPAHECEHCHDVEVRCIKFVLPEQLDVSGGCDCLCDARHFKVRFLANYIDTDFVCCDL